MKHRVKVDGIEKILVLQGNGTGNRDHYQYNSDRNANAHCFRYPLSTLVGKKFRTNGHDYEVLGGEINKINL